MKPEKIIAKNTRMPFGKYKGVKLINLNYDYVRWFIGVSKEDNWLVKRLKIIEAELSKKHDDKYSVFDDDCYDDYFCQNF